MPDEVIQSDNAMITKPEVLTADALKPASTDDLMEALNRVGPEDSAAARQTPSGQRRGRGRPPGSKNRTPQERLKAAQEGVKGITTEQLIKARQDKAAQVKKRAEEISVMISTDLNDHLMGLLIGAGIPATAIYKVPPAAEVVNSNYTPIGNAIAIPPNLAKSAGRLVAELEGTDSGSKVMSVVEGGKAPLVVATISTIVGAVMYANKLNKTMEQFKPLLDQVKAAKEGAARGTDNDDKSNVNGTAPITDMDVARGLHNVG